MSLIQAQTLKCPACSAAYSAGEDTCQFCGSPLPQESSATTAATPTSDGNEDIIDYYSLIGLHALEQPERMEIEEAALTTQNNHMLNQYMDAAQRKEVVERIEVGTWILTDERARRIYDGLLTSLRQGNFTPAHLGTLSDLQREARAALGLENDETAPEELLHQGAGFQALGMHQEAVRVLKRAVEGLPGSAEAHYRYAQALLNSDNPLSLSSHQLRQAASSFHTATQIDSTLHDASAQEALCQGLLARQDGDAARACAELQRATSIDPRLGVAWRALAALALQRNEHDEVMRCARYALQSDPRDEQTYLLLVASCWRAGQRSYAEDAARRVAALRGAGWTMQRILQEVIP
jgi:tetratricopeptide (TPR) repeat protein